MQPDGLWHMGLFESLPRSTRQIDRAGVNEQDDNIMGGDNMQMQFCAEETALFSPGGGWRSH